MTLGSPFAARKARIEIIPLIDVMFFLLASFMMVSLSLQHLRTLRAELPGGTPAAGDSRMLVVEVAADGSVAVGGSRMNVADLRAVVRERVEADPDHPVYLRPAGATEHERVVAVLDLVRGAGARRVALAVDLADPSSP